MDLIIKHKGMVLPSAPTIWDKYYKMMQIYVGAQR